MALQSSPDAPHRAFRSERSRGRRRPFRPLVCLAAVLTVAAAGCSRQDPPAHMASAAPPASQPVVLPVSSSFVNTNARMPGPHAVVINAWATWCVPCREEFPDLVRLERTYRDHGVRLVLLSLDTKESLPDVRKFLREHGVSDTTFIRGSAQNDQQFIDGLDKRWSGALPATWVLDGAGHVRSFWEGQADYVRMERAVLAALQAPIPETSTENQETRP